MKHFNFFITILLFTTTFTNARQTSLKKPIFNRTSDKSLSQNQLFSVPTTPLLFKTYKDLHDEIQKMPSKNVITNDGTLTNSFVTLIISNAKKLNLDPLLTKSLLETGMSLHFQSNANDAQLTQAITYNGQQIDMILQSFTAGISQPRQTPRIEQASPEQSTTSNEPAAEPIEAEMPQAPAVNPTTTMPESITQPTKNSPQEPTIAQTKLTQQTEPFIERPIAPDESLTQPIKTKMPQAPAVNPTTTMPESITQPTKISPQEPTIAQTKLTQQTEPFIERPIAPDESLTQPIKTKMPQAPAVNPKTPTTQPTSPQQKKIAEPVAQPTKTSPQELPIAQPKAPISQPQPTPTTPLHELLKQTAAGPREAFYANNTVNKQWLATALSRALNGIRLVTGNKTQIQGELVGTATEIMSMFLQKKRVSSQERDAILASITQQVIAFMNEQPLADESPIKKPSITHKTPMPQTVLPQPKKSPTELQTEPSKKIVPEPAVSQSNPIWMNDNNELRIKEFEIELLNYIFKHQEATQKEALAYFAQQLPQELKNNDNILSSLKNVIKKVLVEPEKPEIPEKLLPKERIAPIAPVKTPSKRASLEKPTHNQLPKWINPNNLIIISNQLKNDALTYFTQHPDADDDEIINYFISQLPENVPNRAKFERQIGIVVKRIFE